MRIRPVQYTKSPCSTARQYPGSNGTLSVRCRFSGRPRHRSGNEGASARAPGPDDGAGCGRARNHGNSRIRRGPVRAQVSIARVIGRRHRARAAGECVQVIRVKSRRRDERVIPVADEDEIAIGDSECLIRTSIGSIEALNAVPVRTTKAIVSTSPRGLLQPEARGDRVCAEDSSTSFLQVSGPRTQADDPRPRRVAECR